MQTSSSIPQGVWLPLITPFKDGAFDEVSARRLARHYVGAAVDGFILAATTGEGLTIDDDEIERFVGYLPRRDRRGGAAHAALSRTVRQRHAQGHQGAGATRPPGRSTAI